MASLSRSYLHLALAAALVAGGVLAYRASTVFSEPASRTNPDLVIAVEQVTTGRANVRNKPSTIGSRILSSLEAGVLVRGYWVDGQEGQRWLRLQQANLPEGYVWSGNLKTAAEMNFQSGLEEFNISSVTIGRAIKNNRVSDIVTDNIFQKPPATIAFEFAYAGANVGDEFNCSFGQSGISSFYTKGLFKYASGTAWCSFEAKSPGEYALAVSYRGQERWSGKAILAPDLAQAAKPEADIRRSASDKNSMNSIWAGRQANQPMAANLAAGRSRRLGQVGAEAAPSASPFQGRWRGIGQDEGIRWDIILNLDANMELGQPIGWSEYRFRSAFGGTGVCYGQLLLLESNIDDLLIDEIKQIERDRGCISNAPYGKYIRLKIDKNQMSATWTKKNKKRKVTMQAELSR